MRVVLRSLGLFIGLAIWSGVLGAQISPGPLSRAHQEMEGATKCGSCHVFGLGERALRCLDCHTEISRRVTGKLGYHARNFKASGNQLDCARCHTEHNGRQFQITKFDRAGFAHVAQTGFELAGKHASLQCETCHNVDLMSVRTSEIKMRDYGRSFLGLPTECTRCHREDDPHKGQLGGQCGTCHSQDSWKPASAFDHGRSSYPLTGRHQKVSCSGCHKSAPGETEVAYRGFNFSTCDACHTDPHKGAFANASFQGNCESCHVTADWKALRSGVGFDHNRTKFPLLGKHREATCFKCHKSSDFSQPVAFALCADCHEDIHQGQFRDRSEGSDCSSCHNEQGFQPSLFTIEHHQKSRFALEGKHTSVECGQCHKPAGPDVKYALGLTTCDGCHSDPHQSEFKSEPYNNRCEACHTQSAFHPSTFTLPEHQRSKFILTGAHLATACVDCHRPFAGATNAAARQYHLSAQKCTACHLDPHRTREDCETCHNTERWDRVRVFDHSRTTFALVGAHQQVTCIGCHRPAAAPTGQAARASSTADFFTTPTLCRECHDDIHGGQFMQSENQKECETCHTVSTWSTAVFDHDKTKFPLDGAHDEVRCVKCHSQTTDVDGRTVRLYRGAPVTCEACHADGTPVAR